MFEDTPQERGGNLAKEGTLVDGESDGQENGGQERGKREGTKPRPQKRLHCPLGIRTTSQAPALPASAAALRPAAPAAARPSASPPAAVPSPRRPAPPPAPVPLTRGAQSPAPASCFGTEIGVPGRPLLQPRVAPGTVRAQVKAALARRLGHRAGHGEPVRRAERGPGSGGADAGGCVCRLLPAGPGRCVRVWKGQ